MRTFKVGDLIRPNEYLILGGLHIRPTKDSNVSKYINETRMKSAIGEVIQRTQDSSGYSINYTLLVWWPQFNGYSKFFESYFEPV